MKKMIFSAAAFGLVAASSIALAPTTAEAIPAFARQTGAACLSCHFQTFPAINAFGRAFKMGSFTDVGDQALVEDDNLSIPATLNASIVLRGNYTNTKTTNAQAKGTYQIPADVNLLVAGRVGSNTGAFVEFAGGTGGVGTTAAGNWQLLNSFDVGDFKVGLGVANSGFGGDAGMTVSNVYGQHSGKLAGGDVSAIAAAGFTQATGGIDAWIGNDMGYVYVAGIAPDAALSSATNVGTKLGKLVRVMGMFDVGGWDTLVGFGVVTGEAGKNATATPTTLAVTPMDLQFIDAQMQGDVGDTSVGIYADWAHAKGKTSSSGTGNFYGGGVLTGQKYDAYSVRVDVKPFHNILFGAGYGYNKKTAVAAATAATVVKTSHVAATYEVYQNFEINVVYNSAKTSGGGAASTTTNTTLIEFEALM